MPALASTIDQALIGTTGSLVHDAFTRGWEEASPKGEWPLAQRSEILDAVTCALCRAVDGQIISRDDERYAKWQRGLHINCRGIMVKIHRDEVGPDGRPTQPDWTDPDPELIEKHGHFVAQPEKYAALNVPARPTGRDFIAYRPGGQRHVTLRWRPSLPKWAVQETLQTMAAGITDIAAMPLPGDVSLANQMIGHAADTELFTDWRRGWERHRDDWADVVGTLSEDDYRAIPGRTMWTPGNGLGARVSDRGEVEWIIHNDLVPLDASRELPDVALIYSPDRGELVNWQRLAPEPLVDPSLPPPGVFSSAEEAQAWARAAWPRMEWELRGAHPELLYEAVLQWRELSRGVPSITARVRSIRVSSMLDTQKGIAYAPLHSPEIVLHGAHWANPEPLRDRLRTWVERGWHVPGEDSAASTVTHELGHHARRLLEERGASAEALAVFATEHRLAELSGYAAEYGGEELFAEAFAYLVHNEPGTWPPAIRAYADLLRERGLMQ